LNERQIEALRLMVNEKISFSNKLYRKHFNVSNQTFVRDMNLMNEIGQVQSIGKGCALRYVSNWIFQTLDDWLKRIDKQKLNMNYW